MGGKGFEGERRARRREDAGGIDAGEGQSVGGKGARFGKMEKSTGAGEGKRWCGKIAGAALVSRFLRTVLGVSNTRFKRHS